MIKKIVCLCFLLSFYAVSLAVAEEKDFLNTEIYFKDICLGKRTMVTTGESNLVVSITGLKPYSVIDVMINVEPIFINTDDDEVMEKKNIKFTKVNVGRDGEFHYVKHIRLKKIPEDQESAFNMVVRSLAERFQFLSKTKKIKLPYSKIYKATLSWNDHNENLYGRSSSDLFLAEKSEKLFVSQKGPICFWETEAQIISEYNFNETLSNKVLTRNQDFAKTTAVTLNYGHGPMMEVNPDLSTVTASPVGFIGGIFFKKIHAYSRSKTTHTSLIQRWALEPGQGGFFGNRLSYSRYIVESYNREYNTESGCYEWKKSEESYLDVGAASTDLYLVPQEYSGNMEESMSFIQKVRPSLDTCKTPRFTGKVNFIVSDSDDLLYAYPLSENQ
ncbi:MAG: hypothetical protein HQK50_12270 [Oligoflexia bacterium]|nr:hypothetical protein [Oligoflexia bacterium]MBF0366341.1 hypothetical protein [Oligoflexia bacterium]